MSSERNIIKVYFKGTHLVHSKTQYQYNHGMVLHFADLNLPQAFETHFANKQHGNSKTVIGSENKVEIPDEYFWTGANEIYAWVYLHSNVDDGETVYEVRIPLVKRAKPTDEEPLPEQQSAIDRAIAELSHAVETTNADAEQTSADREAVTELRDEVINLRDEAEQSAQTATAKANEASESASSASESEQNAHDYADDAKRYAENAFSSKEIAVASASDAEQAKEDAEQARDDAQDVRSDTIQLKQDVIGLKDDVVNLKDDVIDLKEQTDTNVTHYPKIVDEYWHVWDATQNDFVNTGVDAEGEKGDKGDTGDKGDKGDSGVFVGDDEPLDESYDVWIDTDDGDVVESIVQDVQINGVSIVDNNEVANIPTASANDLGVCLIDPTLGVNITNTGKLGIVVATSTKIKEGTEARNALVPKKQHEATFYGLATASGDTTQSQSNNPVGQYTDEAKTAIQNMLDVPSSDDVVNDVQINGTSIVNNGVATIPPAQTNSLGLVKMGQGLNVSAEGTLYTTFATPDRIKAENTYYMPITPVYQHVAAFYGLAHASGDTTQKASSNEVGTYTDEAKTSIQSMLGVPSADEVVTDVQVDGTSILSNGVANVPKATDAILGVVKAIPQGGLQITSMGNIGTAPASSVAVKTGLNKFAPIVPDTQHESAFYGLAKAAGDTTQSQSDNAVGTYTESAKSAIKSMLGINDITYVPVSGSTPTIVAEENHYYTCGQITSLDFTPSATGICDVVFTSGASSTVLTLPETVKFPNAPLSIEANKTYEINILNGVHGVVMEWI